MRPDGWIILVLSWSAILGMFAYSMYRTLRGPRKSSPDDGHSPSAGG